MLTRSIALMSLALAVAPALLAETTVAPRAGAAKALAASPAIPLTLAALFETSTEVTLLADGTSVVEAPVQSVLVAHRAADGTMVVTCVASPEAAMKLLTAPVGVQAQPPVRPEEK